ncbi:uncharacterized protein JCM6883_003630 [Sporobolomyces salmoneus]|uniref:uncharacterized protein n=1 Tax=Sporobolomyces salmoneus TaxID=183962 RepID=UPI003172E3B0
MVATSAVEGPSNIPGYSIAAGMTSPASKGTAAILSTATQASNAGGSGINTDLALGLGLGLGISALLAVAVSLHPTLYLVAD